MALTTLGNMVLPTMAAKRETLVAGPLGSITQVVTIEVKQTPIVTDVNITRKTLAIAARMMTEILPQLISVALAVEVYLTLSAKMHTQASIPIAKAVHRPQVLHTQARTTLMLTVLVGKTGMLLMALTCIGIAARAAEEQLSAKTITAVKSTPMAMTASSTSTSVAIPCAVLSTPTASGRKKCAAAAVTMADNHSRTPETLEASGAPTLILRDQLI